ncbi:MAG: lipid-A-disaccharide synthase [Gammaproteobacteria bacterium]|nr:lipid-A-disaccharide synthase [Gammaproteobacteria bacterium]
MRIGIVAGEASGDLLGEGLVIQLKNQLPELIADGIAGPKMIAQGVHSLYPMERLSVMGLTEVFSRYFELVKMRRDLVKYFIEQKIELFIGIDAPDFNLGLEQQLHKAGIKIVHYVSPSVWVWRQYRIKKIVKSVDLMLTLFPHEARFYRAYDMPVEFVGHPLADHIPDVVDKPASRKLLGLPHDKKIVAILPGSRSHELHYLADSFLSAAQYCVRERDDLHFITPLASPERRLQFEAALRRQTDSLPITLVDGLSFEVMAAADVVLLASGTAALEALLMKRPMVVAYRVAPLTYWISKCLVKTSVFSLPNLLARESLVPEFIQYDIVPEKLARCLLDYIDHPDKVLALDAQFRAVHESLRKNASVAAANAILKIYRG